MLTFLIITTASCSQSYSHKFDKLEDLVKFYNNEFPNSKKGAMGYCSETGECKFKQKFYVMGDTVDCYVYDDKSLFEDDWKRRSIKYKPEFGPGLYKEIKQYHNAQCEFR